MCQENDVWYYAMGLGRKHRKWSFPKGHMEQGESPDECMYREIREEVGITESDLGHMSKSFKLRGDYYRVFQVPGRLELIVHDTDELLEARWISEAELTLDFLEQCNAAARYFFTKSRMRKWSKERSL